MNFLEWANKMAEFLVWAEDVEGLSWKGKLQLFNEYCRTRP